MTDPLFVILFGLICMLVGLQLPNWLTRVVSWYEKRAIYKEILPTEVIEERMCKGPHSWTDVPTTDGSGNYGTLSVCADCGFIPSRNLMATKIGLERIESNKKLFAFEKKVEQAFIDGENELLNYFVKQEKVTMDHLVEVYNAGKTSAKRFVIFKIAVTEQEKRTNDTEAQNS